MPNRKGQIEKGEHFNPATEFKKGHSTWNKGTHIQTNTGRTHLKKGHIPWNRGIRHEFKCSICGVVFQKIGNRPAKYCSRSCFFKGYRGENNPNWLGDEVGYGGIHDWVEATLGKPRKCEECKSKSAKKYHWHNISHEYKRDTSDWIRLCAKCHVHKHKNWEKRWPSVVVY